MPGVVQNLSYILLGEDRSASKAMQAAESTAQKVTGTIGSAFGKLGGVIGGEFGGMLQDAGAHIQELSAKGKSLSSTLEVGGAITAGAGLALMQYGSGAKQATDQLDQAIKTAGDSTEKYGEKIDQAVAKAQNFDHSAEDTKAALTRLIPATGSTQKALDKMGVVTDLAAAKHISLADAASQVAKILGGSGARTLTQYGITMQKASDPTKALASAQAVVTSASNTLAAAQKRLSDLQDVDHAKKKLTVSDHIALKNAQDAVTAASGKLAGAQAALAETSTTVVTKTQAGQQALDQLAAKLKGQDAAAVNNFGSQFDIVKTKVEDFVKEAAGPVGQTMTVLGPIFAVAGLALDIYKTKQEAATAAAVKATIATEAQAGAATASVTATEAETVAMTGLDASMDANPIGLVAVALGGLAAVAGGALLSNQQAVTNSEQAYTAALTGATGAIEDNIRASTAKQLNDAGALAAARELGISQATAVAAAMGNRDATLKVAAALQKYKGDMVIADQAQGTVFAGLDKNGVAANKLASAIGQTSEGLKAYKQSQADLAAGLNTTASSAANAAAQVGRLNSAVGTAPKGTVETFTVSSPKPGTVGRHAAGGSFVTSSPTMLTPFDQVGESGPERVDITPLNAGRLGGAAPTEVHIHFEGTVYGDPNAFGRAAYNGLIQVLRGGSSKTELKHALGV